MNNFKRRSYIVALIIILVAVFSIAFYILLPSITPLLSGFTALEKTSIGLAIINGIATIGLMLVAYINMRESKKVRGEMVRPHLALEPSFFEYDAKSEIVGFNCLNLVNGGTVARDVEIDISLKDSSRLFYASSIGTNDRVKIWSGQSSELGGNIVVVVRYKNLFNKSLQEVLSVNVDSLNSSKRKLVAIHNS
jgi:hypothetical protein